MVDSDKLALPRGRGVTTKGDFGLTPAPNQPHSHAMTFSDIKGGANLIRSKIKDLGDEVKTLKDNAVAMFTEPNVDKSEVIANLQLSFRHLEDARMRLGKTIQAIDGGKSVYDAGQQGQA